MKKFILLVCCMFLCTLPVCLCAAPARADLYQGCQMPGVYDYGLALGDVNGDGYPDAVITQVMNKPTMVWINDGGGWFTDSGQSLGSLISYGAELGDLNGDGSPDVFIAHYSTGSGNRVWLNNGSGVFTDSGQSLGNSFTTAVCLGDVDGNGTLDAFVANTAAGGAANRVWLNNGSGVFTDSGQSLGSSQSMDAALGDLNGDGHLDAFVANRNNSANTVWLNNGSGVFIDSGQSLGALNSDGVVLGDVDGNGSLDAVVVNSKSIASHANKVWLNNGSGVFTDSGQSLGAPYFGYDAALGDLDGDGAPDIYFGQNTADTVWLNNGSGVFTDSGQSLGNTSSDAVRLGDLDGDGDLDVFVISYDADGTLTWINGAPEIEITGNGSSIADGDISPAEADHTDFGQVPVTGGTVTRTFIVKNSASSALYLTGSPRATLGGAQAADFTIAEQPDVITLKQGQSTTVQVSFDPSATGVRAATLSIASSDPDESPYVFAVQGTGTEPPAVVTDAPDSVTAEAALLHGSITAPGYPDPTAHGFVWNTGGMPTLADTVIDNGPTAVTGTYSTHLSGLSPGTTYYVRAFATNSCDTGYGDQEQFDTLTTTTTTTSAPPSTTTTSIKASTTTVPSAVTVDTGDDCVFEISPQGTLRVPAEGDNGSIEVSTDDAGCCWSAAANISWITITRGTEDTRGCGTAAYKVAPNPGARQRYGRIMIALNELLVLQEGAAGDAAVTTTADDGGGGPAETTTTAAPDATTTTTAAPQVTTTTSAPGTTTTVPDETPCPVEMIYGEGSFEADLLQRYRDEILGQTPEGRRRIGLYYRLAPAAAQALERDGQYRQKARELIDLLLPYIEQQLQAGSAGDEAQE